MTTRPPLLHRDDPDKAPLVGHVKVTREDWLNVARDILVSDGMAEVKVMVIGDRLGVSRSSFYWYFKSRNDLLDALLSDWEQRNTATIKLHCELPATTISHAVCNFFKCFLNPDLFDHGLDFAIREWSRRSGPVRSRLDAADAERLDATVKMFERFNYPAPQAHARARILYYMQLGYHALEVREPMEQRISRLHDYLIGFTGVDPEPNAIQDFQAYLTTLANPDAPAP